MKKYLAAMALLPVLFLFGCGGQGTETTTTTSTTTTTTLYASYFPLIVGRVMTYEVTNYLSYGTTTETVTVETWIYRGTTYIPGTTFEVFMIEMISGGASEEYYYREDATGAYTYGNNHQPTTEGRMLIKYPAVVGATWESGTGFGPNEIVTQEGVTTAAGNFTAKKVAMASAPGGWYYTWFAQDVGLVRKYSGYGGISLSWTTREVVSKNF